MDWTVIVTSAAVGVLVSAIMNLAGQYFERRSRRKELLLTKAIDLANRKTDLAMKSADTMKRKLVITDPVKLAAGYYRALDHLLDHDELPKNMLDRMAKSEEDQKKLLEELDRDES